MRDVRRGIGYGVLAYAMWGFFPFYWLALKSSGSIEILAHRIVWSLVAVAAILAVRRNWSWIAGLSLRRLGLLALAAVFITVNWGTYIYAVNTDRTIEAALGYFTNPLVSILLGVLVFRERLRGWQWCAICLAFVAVLILAIDYGRPPWIALTLAFSFGTYGMIKKIAATGSAESLAVETLIITGPALAYILTLESSGDGTFTSSAGHALLLAGAGVATAVPLMLFNAAAVRIPLSYVGMLQYITPSLQFLIGWLILHEDMPASRWAGFILVWTALAILTADGLRTARTAPGAADSRH